MKNIIKIQLLTAGALSCFAIGSASAALTAIPLDWSNGALISPDPDLDGDADANTYGAGTQLVRWTGVGTESGVLFDVILTNTTDYFASNITNTGTANNDGQINLGGAGGGQTASFSLQFVDPTMGDAAVIVSCVEMGWFDLDFNGGESVTLDTQPVSVTYSSTTDLTGLPAGPTTSTITVTGHPTANIGNPSNSASMSANQEDVSFIATYANQSTMNFSLTVANTSSGRNFLWDDDIVFDDTTEVTIAVPEPSSTALLGLGGLALILRRRK